MSGHTLHEILSQPEVWEKVIQKTAEYAHQYERVVLPLCSEKEFAFIGCGTSYYLALCGSVIYTNYSGNLSRAMTASDILFYPESFFQKTPGCCSMLISRSGTTTEVVRATKQLKKDSGYMTCAISCRPESALAKECEHAFVIPEADEKSVVMTRSFTSMLLLIQLFSSFHSRNNRLRDELTKLPEQGKNLFESYGNLAAEIFEQRIFKKIVYLGQGPNYGLACESMLKIKEMSLTSSEAYHSLEFRHGPMSLADEEMLLVYLMSDRARDEEVQLLKETRNLGVTSLVICERSDKEILSTSNYVVELDSGLSDYVRSILYMPIPQLLGYHCAKAKGLDPDKPRHLSQVVEI